MADFSKNQRTTICAKGLCKTARLSSQTLQMNFLWESNKLKLFLVTSETFLLAIESLVKNQRFFDSKDSLVRIFSFN